MSNLIHTGALSLAVGLAFLGSGCQQGNGEQTNGQPPPGEAGRPGEEARERAPGQEPQLSQAERTAWEQAAQRGNYTVQFESGGKVTATKAEPPSGTPLGDEVLTQAVETKLAAAPALSGMAKDIDVSADQGVVTLRGNVRTLGDATTAVTEAIQTPGVNKVTSELSYPR